ncbi:SDR family NAD(P)-dependent oxidoreductase [Streptomyces sp. NPDC060064]|uniref:SDR family NAD(P)-dependent oxidoreductase n=1 Tax=Streptomyces sp. NPDC060064 TaxID=3347049 RepID=UPI0036CB2C1C
MAAHTRGSGSVINIDSLGLAAGAAYRATKAALASLKQGWTAKYSSRGVRFNTVAPGPVYTREPRPATCSARSPRPP